MSDPFVISLFVLAVLVFVSGPLAYSNGISFEALAWDEVSIFACAVIFWIGRPRARRTLFKDDFFSPFSSCLLSFLASLR